MTLIRSAYTPESFQVREGDQVTLKITNVETIRDMIHGFALPDHNLNIALAPGYTKTITFDAGKPGVYWFYCTNFCSALHLEMRGRMVVQPKDGDRDIDRLARGGECERTGRLGCAIDGRQQVRAPSMYVAAAAFAAAALVLPLWGFSMSAPAVPGRDAPSAGPAGRDRGRRP